MKITDNGVVLNLDNSIKSGGEGSIYIHPKNKKEVIKIYHQKKDISYKQKLEKLSFLDSNFIKPKRIIVENNYVLGFVMDFVNFNDFYLLNKLFNKLFCTQEGFDYNFKKDVLETIKTSLLEVHSKGFIIGDLNQYNIFFNSKKEVVFVDVDSYQEENHITSDFVLDDIKDFSSPKLCKNSDIWAYDILTFWILSFVHPFKWTSKSVSHTFQEKIRKGLSFISNIPNINIPPIYEKLSLDMENQFKEIFGGRRYLVSFIGTSTVSPVQLKVQAQSSSVKYLLVSDKVSRFVFSLNHISIKENNIWKRYKFELLGSPFLVEELQYDFVYVSNDNYCYVQNSKLYNSKKQEVFDLKDTNTFYSNGNLYVLLDNDESYLFKINNQLSNIENIRNVVYSKSIQIRDSIIQNFGQKVIINDIQNGNNTQFDAPFTIKNAITNGNYTCIEYTENNKIVYAIFKKNNLKLEKLFYVNSLVNFTTKGDILFIPQNNEILIYKNDSLLEKLDFNHCSEQSILHLTQSGILLLEKNNLYLLNKI